MSLPLRLLFLHGAGDTAAWRAGFDLAQAAAALDVPLEIGFAGAGLDLIRTGTAAAHGPAGGAFASLALLGIDQALAPAAERVVDGAALPLLWLDAAAWQSWLRRAPLQVW